MWVSPVSEPDTKDRAVAFIPQAEQPFTLNGHFFPLCGQGEELPVTSVQQLSGVVAVLNCGCQTVFGCQSPLSCQTEPDSDEQIANSNHKADNPFCRWIRLLVEPAPSGFFPGLRQMFAQFPGGDAERLDDLPSGISLVQQTNDFPVASFKAFLEYPPAQVIG